MSVLNIYFVCTGNTCRSPMAEAMLKHKNIPEVNVRSAGIYARAGEGMSGNSIVILEEAEIPHSHTAKQIQLTDMEWADLILTMTVSHKDMILRIYGENVQNKIFTLKEYISPNEGMDVTDPYGGDLTMYRQTYTELKELIDELEKGIERGEY